MTINLFFWLLSGVDGTLPANMLGLFHFITIILRAERVRTESSFVHLNKKVEGPGLVWIRLDINKFYLFLLQARSCRNNPLDLSHCHFQPYCWEMNVLQVYETVLKPEI